MTSGLKCGWGALAIGVLGSIAADSALAAHADDEVVVSAPPLPGALTVPNATQAQATLERTPGGASLVDDASYRGGRVSTLQDALGYAAGVFVQPRFGSDEARLSIRGSGVQRTFHLRGIELLQDGVPLTAADGGGDFQAVDALTADYIEIQRGANALQYGATTLGGAVNFISPTGFTAPRGELRAEYGSFDYQRLLAATGGVQGAADYYLAATYAHQDGFRAHSRQENYRLSGNVGVQLAPDLESRFYLYVADSDSELPGNLTRAELARDPGLANAGNVAGDNKRDFLLWRAANKTAWQWGSQRLEFAAFYVYKDLFHPIFQVLDVVSRDYGVSLRFQSAAPLFGRQNVFTAGFVPHWGDTADDRFANVRGGRGARRNQLDQRAANYALFVENQHYVLHQLALVTGLQLTRSEREMDDRFLADGDASFDERFEAVSPKLGVRYELSREVQIFANVSRSFEPPSFGELTGGQLVSVVSAQEATTLEVGSRGASTRAHTRWDVAYYRAWVRDELLSLTDPTGQPLGTVSADETIHQGLELGLAHWLGERVEIRQNYLWTDLRFDGDRVFGDNRLAGLPEHLYRAEILYRWPQGYYAGPKVEWMATDHPVDHANTLFADSYALVGLTAGYRGPRWSWFVDARNLGDTSYAAATGVIANAAGRDSAQFLPGDGIALYGGIELTF